MKLKDCGPGDEVIIKDWQNNNKEIVCTVVLQDDGDEYNDTLIAWGPGEQALDCYMWVHNFTTEHVRKMLENAGFDRAVWLWDETEVSFEHTQRCQQVNHARPLPGCPACEANKK